MVEEYENRVHPIAGVTPLEVLLQLIEKHGLKQKDLAPELSSESNVSQILSGARNLTLAHLYALASRWLRCLWGEGAHWSTLAAFRTQSKGVIPFNARLIFGMYIC